MRPAKYVSTSWSRPSEKCNLFLEEISTCLRNVEDKKYEKCEKILKEYAKCAKMDMENRYSK